MFGINLFKPSIRHKLEIGFGSVILLVIIVTIISLIYLDKIDSLTDEIIPYSDNMVELNDISVSLSSVGNNIDKYLICGSIGYKETYNEKIKNILERLEYAIILGSDGKLIEFKASINRLDRTLALLEDPEVPKDNASFMNSLHIGIYSELAKSKQISNELLLENINFLKKNVDEQKIVINALNLQFIILMIIIILVGLIISYFTSISISRPIEKLEHASKQVARGNLKFQLDLNSKDELGLLEQSFNYMTKSLLIANEKNKRHNLELEQKVKERTAQLQKAYNELKVLDEQKDLFTSIAAHELKTPLTSIRGFAQMLQDENIVLKPKERANYFRLINKNTERLYGFITDMIDSTRLNLGKIKIVLSNLDVANVFNEVKESMEVVLDEKGITSNFEMEKDLPHINGDIERVMQVLRNLIINSVHATPKGGKISLIARRKGNFVQFEVKDNGIGISKKDQKYLFSRFYQANDSHRRSFTGSGLGLSICKGMIKLMKGKIWLESHLGKGTTVYFALPIAHAAKKVESEKRK